MLVSLLLCSMLVIFVGAYCPDGMDYDSNLNKCYALINDPQNFVQAEQYCARKFSGHLADIQNGFENSYVTAMTTGSFSTWIGLNYLVSQNWTWTRPGASTDYWNLDSSIADPSIFQCAEVNNNNGAWNKAMCNKVQSFVCKADPSPCGTFICDRFYTQSAVDCKCYKYVPLLGNYNDSVAACKRESATLAIILSKEQNDFIANLIGFIDGFVWIGLQCLDSNPGNCTWMDGTKLTGYGNFIDSNPQGDYGTVLLQYDYAEFGMWSAQRYNAYAYALCQKDSYDNS